MPVTICLTYFRSLTLANLAAALYSVRQQDMSLVVEVVVVDNNTTDTVQEIQDVIDLLEFPVPVKLRSFKHGDLSKTHSWSTNVAVREALTPWVLFTRADYLLDFQLVERFIEIVELRSKDWNGFVTSNVYQTTAAIEACESTDWRRAGPNVLQQFPGSIADYTVIDTGVWMAQHSAFDRVHGLDETLITWGHAQTDFQYRLHVAGTEFIRIPETLFFHPQHEATRDLALAHQQLRERGIDIKELWARHEGVQLY